MSYYPYDREIYELKQELEGDRLTRIFFDEEKDGTLVIRLERLGYRGFYMIRKWELEVCRNRDDLIKYSMYKLYEMAKRGTSHLTKF